MGALAMTYLDNAELEALVALGLLEIMKSGATILVDQFRPRQRAIFDFARQWGLRLYGCPYLFSAPAKVQDAKVAAAAQGSLAGDPGLAAFERLFAATTKARVAASASCSARMQPIPAHRPADCGRSDRAGTRSASHYPSGAKPR